MRHCLPAVVDVQLAKDAVDVVLHGGEFDRETGRDLLV